jgi:hypothetical protein
MISRELIRDQSISPECRWLIIYLLANKDNWKIHLREIINHCKGQVGRDRVYEIVNEAIVAGYMCREKYLVKGLERVRYLVSESPKFKKSLPHPENPDADIPDTENKDSKGIATSKEKQIEEPSKGPIPSKEKEVPPSATAAAMCEFMHAAIKKNKPNLRPIKKAWYKNAEKLLEQRSPEELRKIIDWVVRDTFWSGVILSPESLEKNLDKIEMQMIKKASLKSSSMSVMEDNQRFAEAIKARYPHNRDIEIGSGYIEFNFGQSRPHIKFTENGFMEQVENNLRKMGLKLEDV